jgi:hypothetical protein
VKEQGISGYAGILAVPGDIRILVKPITDLQQELALYHELGHAITHALNEEEGIFKTWTSSYDEAMTVVIERIPAFIVLDDAQRKVAQNLWLLEATRCATSALFELELWDQPDAAEGLYRALLRGVGYRRSACWCLGCRLISYHRPGLYAGLGYCRTRGQHKVHSTAILEAQVNRSAGHLWRRRVPAGRGVRNP